MLPRSWQLRCPGSRVAGLPAARCSVTATSRFPRSAHLPPAGSFCLRSHPPRVRHHVVRSKLGPRTASPSVCPQHEGCSSALLSPPPQPHLLHGGPLLHQQDLLHAVPIRAARPRPPQSRRQRQEEELMAALGRLPASKSRSKNILCSSACAASASVPLLTAPRSSSDCPTVLQ